MGLYAYFARDEVVTEATGVAGAGELPGLLSSKVVSK